MSRNPFSQPNPQPERPRRPASSPFRVDPFEQRGNPFAAAMSDDDAKYWTALLVYEIAEWLDGGAS